MEEIAALLVREGLLEDAGTFTALCRDAQVFAKYPFIAGLSNTGERRYALEGYLFPDTYEIYTLPSMSVTVSAPGQDKPSITGFPSCVVNVTSAPYAVVSP